MLPLRQYLRDLFKPFTVANSDGQALGDGIGNRLA